MFRMAKPMTKGQFLAHISEKSGMSKKDVAQLWDMIVAKIMEETKSIGQCVLPGLGKMVKQHRAARMGRNPATGESIQIPARTVVKFRIAKAAKEGIL